MDNLFGNIKKLNRHENTEVTENKLNRDEVLANYSFDYDVDDELKEYLKDVTYKIHGVTQKFYTELGKMLLEAQEKLSNNKTGVFIKWAESLGIKKDNAYRYINRYKYIVAIRDNITVAKVESLPFSLSYEIAKDSVPQSIREKVISGEIKTVKDFRNELKEVQHEEPREIIQEAEIVEEVGLEKFDLEKQIILNSLEAALEKIKNGANTPENLKKLLTAQGIIDSVK